MRKLIIIGILSLPFLAQGQTKQYPYHMQDSTMVCDSCPDSYRDSVRLSNLTTEYSSGQLIGFELSHHIYYNIDWRKVKTLKDLKAILSAMNIQFSSGLKNFKSIKKYLIEVK